MDTMYAGRPGTPFIIKKSFKTVEEMKEEFHNGDSSDVWFGEYCIIDTVNKNDRSNGSIYQRGPNYAKDDGDARYIGRIVGPASGTPSFSLGTIDDVENKVVEKVDAQTKHVFPSTLDDAVNGLHFDKGNITHNDDWDPKLEVKSLSVGNVGLVPGKDGDVYNDDVKYTWCNIEYPEDDNSPTVTYVGFRVPYHVFNFSASVRSPYDDNGNRDDKMDFTDLSPKDHPFYHDYSFSVPRGITGVCVKEIKTLKVSNLLRDPDTYGVKSGRMFQMSDFSIAEDGGIDFSIPTYNIPTGENDETCKDPWITIAQLVSFSNKKDGEKYWAYVSDYDVLDDMTVEDDGTIVKSYTYRADESIDKRVRWVDSFRIMDDGSVLVDYNNGSPDNFMKLLKWIESLDVSDDGDLTIKFNTDHGEQRFQLNWVKSISLSKDEGDGLLDDKRLQTTTVKGKTAYIGSPVNYILDVYMRPSDYHLMLLYNDETHRGDPSANGITAIDNDSFKDSQGRVWVRKVHEVDGVLTASDTKAWGKVYWQDMGAIKDQSGLLVGGKVADGTISDVIAGLNKDHPNGHPDGKIITAGSEGDSQNFFAYDYNSHKWYYLGNLNKDKLDLAPENTPSEKMKSTGYYVLTGEPPAEKTFKKFWDGWAS